MDAIGTIAIILLIFAAIIYSIGLSVSSTGNLEEPFTYIIGGILVALVVLCLVDCIISTLYVS